MTQLLRTQLRLITLATASVLGLAACGHSPTREEMGTVGGAVLGGAAGHGLTGGSGIGTVGGAAAGAYIGKEIGEDMDRGRRYRR